MITKIKNNWLFFKQPEDCILCGINPANETSLCQHCYTDLPWIRYACKRCGIPLNTCDQIDLTCPACLHSPPIFDQAVAPFEYRFPIDQLIQLAKFSNQSHYLNPLAALLCSHLLKPDSSTVKYPMPEMIIPVPIHPKRLQQRQYNQAALLGREIAKRLQIPFNTKLVIKTTNTPHQADLNRKARKKNLRNSFRCTHKPPSSVAIIDDVMTTGTTAAEISRILKASGCLNIYIWTIAHTAKQLHLG
ncbi:ComF family protein [Amphritea japonica]|uniref:Amidophosphoribosyltransferase n=1 Tax=Amphritea japonica ATCC BAA-1530 TaxID=1278309 RepID=A0A7R6SRM9_9GAMM|nr:ComF family protein [Amphritea japonica]BBB25330.1 amidophosphoribosyltransferase [Amphritea japonica ATCC BAA-1530]